MGKEIFKFRGTHDRMENDNNCAPLLTSINL
jgi:hypothetical protein